VIYVQAKCWAQDRPIQRKDVQSFVGALSGKQASKGVFITTSRYTDGARKYVEAIQPRVILIDGAELAELMIDYGVGVRVTQQYEVRDLDEDYFTDDEGASVVAS
jgi:restriction system protein